MSWDLYLSSNKCDKCGHGDEEWWANYTHNMNGALNEAWGHSWWDLHESKASSVLLRVDLAISRIEENRERFRQFEPDNKWGSVETLLEFLRKVRDACASNPDAVLRVSG